jgi:hypothetical protein
MCFLTILIYLLVDGYQLRTILVGRAPYRYLITAITTEGGGVSGYYR